MPSLQPAFCGREQPTFKHSAYTYEGRDDVRFLQSYPTDFDGRFQQVERLFPLHTCFPDADVTSRQRTVARLDSASMVWASMNWLASDFIRQGKVVHSPVDNKNRHPTGEFF